MNNHKIPLHFNMNGPYFNLKEAAAYLGYHPDSFRRLQKEHNFIIPLCGPNRNRYAKSVLDQFMADPFSFVAEKSRVASSKRVQL